MKSSTMYGIVALVVVFIPDKWRPAVSHTEVTIIMMGCWICYEIAKLRESK